MPFPSTPLYLGLMMIVKGFPELKWELLRMQTEHLLPAVVESSRVPLSCPRTVALSRSARSRANPPPGHRMVKALNSANSHES